MRRDLSNGFKLRGTEFRVSNDHPETLRVKRRNLLNFSKTVVKAGDKVHLRFDKRFVNDAAYV